MELPGQLDERNLKVAVKNIARALGDDGPGRARRVVCHAALDSPSDTSVTDAACSGYGRSSVTCVEREPER